MTHKESCGIVMCWSLLLCVGWSSWRRTLACSATADATATTAYAVLLLVSAASLCCLLLRLLSYLQQKKQKNRVRSIKRIFQGVERSTVVSIYL